MAKLIVLQKFGLCLKLISEMKVKILSNCLENLNTLSLDIETAVFKFSKQLDNIFTFISLISFRHKPNFCNTRSDPSSQKISWSNLCLLLSYHSKSLYWNYKILAKWLIRSLSHLMKPFIVWSDLPSQKVSWSNLCFSLSYCLKPLYQNYKTLAKWLIRSLSRLM